jgi:hypothetical protein
MPTKANVASILKKHLGKEVADAMTAKIDKMIAEKKSAAEIEKAIRADLATRIEKQVVSAIRSLSVSTELRTPIQVKVQPGMASDLRTPSPARGKK